MSPTPPRLTDSRPPSTGSDADRDAATVLDPDTFVSGAPFDALARLRAQAPVHPVQLPDLPRLWLVTRHEDVVAVSRDDARYSSATGNTLLRSRVAPDSAMLSFLDPPRHTHFRKLVSQGFTPRQVSRLEDRVREIARTIVDDVLDRGTFDAVTTISAEISLQVIAEVLGVPQQDRLKIFEWSNAVGSLGIEDPDYSPTPQAVMTAGAQMFQYCDELVARRRASPPQDDIVGALLEAEVDGQRLTGAQLNEFFLLLAVAGNETTRNTLSHGILALSERPDQRRRLAEDPSVLRTAVVEMIRWASPILHFRRTATQDVALREAKIPAGDWVLLHYLSANRDETVFDDAAAFDITREDRGHVAFGGGGTHHCLGHQLARLELRVMLEELYRRVPELTVDGPVERLRSSFLHGIKHLPCSTG